ncbi:MAG: DHA2 family efflux MFS transporter permease subunit [Terracidiphilus sp.]
MTASQPVQEWKPRYNPWLVAVVVAIASFMEVLDTSIANVALPHISGNLGASQDQATWVLTTYLVANAIVLPITGWISSAVGRKRFFLICIALFAASSLLCGLAPSMTVLLLARALQGAGGGGLQPMSQAIMADSFPPRLRGAAFALYGITVLVAPALGPTLGGWITDNYSWRWIFLINLPIGLIALALVFKLVEDPPFLRRFKAGEMHLDSIGLSLLVLGVAALQIFLDKGQEDDWFGSNFITTLVAISLVCLSALIVWEWRHRAPLIDVKLYRSFNFSSINLMMFLAGAVAFSSTVLMPQFLQTLAGYTAQQAGLVVSAGAGILFVTMPVIGMLTSKLPVKYLIAFGWFLSATGLFLSTKLLTLGVSFQVACGIMLLQYAPLGFIFVPAITASYFGISQDRSDEVSGLTNFIRNIGSSVGASVVTTVLARRQQFHLVRLSDHFSPGAPVLSLTFQALASRMHGMGSSAGPAAGLALIYQFLAGQAAALSYIDTYVVLGSGSVAMFFLSFLLQSNDPRHTEQHSAH